MLLVIFDKELLHTVWVSVRSADAVDINEKRTVKSVALLETSQPDNRVVTEQADVAPKCTFAVIQDKDLWISLSRVRLPLISHH